MQWQMHPQAAVESSRRAAVPAPIHYPVVRAMTDLAEENRRLREQMSTLTAEASNNEAILRRSQERELALLNTDTLAGLLAALTRGLGDSFGLNNVSVVLCDPQHEIRHLLVGSGIQPDNIQGVMFVDSLVGLTPIFGSLRKTWLGPYSAADHQLILPTDSRLASVALLPLLRQQRLVGSLNFGSQDPDRFTRHHATDFLNHLAAIAAFCLENAVNREKLVRAGLTDVLTGWYNRRYLQSRLREEVILARRYNQTLVCLLIDIDNFKTINDSHGHLCGDTVLREVAYRVKGQIRGSDVAARFGGDELAVLLPHTDLASGVQMAERIRNAVSATPISLNPANAITVTLSIGVAESSPHQSRAEPELIGEALLQEADGALYQAKSEGRDRVCTQDRDWAAGRDSV